MFDLALVPLSRFGSYFSLSVNGWGSPGKGLFLHSHYSKSPQVFKIDPVRGGQVVDFKTEAAPSVLRLKPDGGGEIEFVIAGTETIRIRGRGTSLRLTMPNERWTFAYQLPGGWAFNFSPYAFQVAIEVMRGGIEMRAPWEKGPGFCWETSGAVATISPDKEGVFEVAIDSFLTAWVKPERRDFDVCRKEVEHEYAEWTKGLPDVPHEYIKTRDLAAYVNWSAVLAPAGNLTRPTMFMSKYSMCNVYHWDHAFNAMAHCLHRPDLAWDQLVLFHDHQDGHGKCPSSVNRNEIRYTISNPPVQGWALRRMWDVNPAMMTPARMEEAYSYLSGWTNWICGNWTWPGDRLPFYHHGFDSGWDNSSIFDEGVPAVSPDQPAYLVLQMEVLADLAEAMGRKADAQSWRKRSQDMCDALVADLWKGDHFVGVVRPSGRIVECDSLITCMPMVLGRRLPENVREGLVARIREHLTPFGLATEKLESTKYQEGGYWRGPIWAPSTMLVVCGLIDIGEKELALTIMRAFCNMCRERGFYENFSPRTGEGHFCPSYTWTSSVFMIFAGWLGSD
jgi:hypothetical protein